MVDHSIQLSIAHQVEEDNLGVGYLELEYEGYVEYLGTTDMPVVEKT